MSFEIEITGILFNNRRLSAEGFLNNAFFFTFGNRRTPEVIVSIIFVVKRLFSQKDTFDENETFFTGLNR